MNTDEKDIQLAKLRNTLGKMEIAFGTIADAIVWFGNNGDIQWCNSTFDHLVDQVHIRLIGKSIYNILPLEENGRPLIIDDNPFQRCFAEKKKIKGKFDFIISGEKKLLEIICSYIFISDDEQVVVSVIRDITTKQELKKYQLLNEALMKAANAIAITDLLGRIIWINPAFTRLTGYSAKEIHFKTFKKLKSGRNNTELYEDLWETIMDGRVWKGKLINRRKDGTTYIEEQTISPVKSYGGKISHFIAVKQDITHLERTNAELEKLSLVASKTDNAVIITDNKGHIEWVNEGFMRITGFKADEVMGQKPGDILQGPETNQETVRRMRMKLEAQEGFSEEVVNYHKDGHAYWLQITTTPVYDSNNKLAHFVAVESDITKQKKVEEKLRRYQDHLEVMVKERTRELKDAQEELINRAMESGREQLAGMIMHNIGNAITPFQTMIEQLTDLFSQKLLGYLSSCFSELEINRNDLSQFVVNNERGQQIFDYMGELIQSLHANHKKYTQNLEKMKVSLEYISEILSMHQTYKPDEISNQELIQPNQLIENSLKMQINAIEKRGIKIKKRFADQLPELKIDKNRLMQVVINLLKNAYESIEMFKDNTLGEIIVLTEFQEGHIVIEITDNGIGITPEKAVKIFEYGKSYKGSSGFGLHYCKMFIENNKGTLEVNSKGIGAGATFSIRLPV